MAVSCGNERHPDGAWHDAMPLPFFTWHRMSRAERAYRRNTKRWGCGCPCTHTKARCIHGDEINAVGGKRGHCPCGAWLDELPLRCSQAGGSIHGIYLNTTEG